MRAAHLLCPQGVAGDLFVAALVDAGAPLGVLRDAVDALDLGDVALRAEPGRGAGIAATAVHVDVGEAARRVETWPEARAVLERATLPGPVREAALDAARRLAEAEAAAHGTTPEEVRYHELGDPDTLADVVAGCAAVHALGIAALTCGPVAVGGGTVPSAHGRLPVPAPAVTELLRGFALLGDGERELTTPTGAALLAALAAPTGGLPPLRLTGTGRGVTTSRDGTATSVLTVLIGEREPDAGTAPAVVVEATVDDLAPDLVPVVLDALRAAGAHDAWAVPVLMKKGRPGHTLVALADEADVAMMEQVLFTESTTIGVRHHHVRKRALPRRTERIEIDGEVIGVKVVELDGRVLRASPEADDVRRVAAALGIPVHELRERAATVARQQHGGT